MDEEWSKIWYANKFHPSKALIVGCIIRTGNKSKGMMNNSVDEFMILKHFNITNYFRKALQVIKFLRKTYIVGIIKCNIDSVV